MTKLKGKLIWGIVIVGVLTVWIMTRPDRLARPFLDVKIKVVDYTTPFDTYKEHQGIFWLLNNLKVRAPGGFRAWRLAKDYIGYYPYKRNAPERLADSNLGDTDVLYLADTYGVYRDDLINIEAHQSHMDHSPIVFGGLSLADAKMVSRFVNRGGTLIVEFNTFCDPTEPAAREMMEEITGMEWSGWVGRFFLKPADVNDVPHWLPREFARQYPERPYPIMPMLVFVDNHGKLMVFEGKNRAAIAPRVEMTPQGVIDLGLMTPPIPYYYWFPLMRGYREAHVYARWSFAARSDIKDFLKANNLALNPPAISKVMRGSSSVYHFAGDFADIDFDPGQPGKTTIDEERERTSIEDGPSSAPIFWYIYAPIINRILSDKVAKPAF